MLEDTLRRVMHHTLRRNPERRSRPGRRSPERGARSDSDDDRWTAEERAEELPEELPEGMVEQCRRMIRENKGHRTFVALYSSPKEGEALGGLQCEMGVLAGTLDATQYRIVLSTTEEKMRKSLKAHTPEVVIFSGHANSKRGLILEDEEGSMQAMSADAFAKAMREAYSSGGGRRAAPSCVALMACDTEEVAEAVSREFPSCLVVYWSSKASTTTAAQFAMGFVSAMAESAKDGSVDLGGEEGGKKAFGAGVAAMKCRPGSGCLLQDPDIMWSALHEYVHGVPVKKGKAMSGRMREEIHRSLGNPTKAVLHAIVGVPAWRKGGEVHEERSDPETVMKTLSSNRVEKKVQGLYAKASGWEVASSHTVHSSGAGKENDDGQALSTYLNAMSLK